MLYVSIGLIVLCVLVLVYAQYLFTAKNWKDIDRADITIGGMHINAEVAASATKKKAGLSARPSLRENEGMLFIFSQAMRYPFWMRGMLIPLDFVWIRDGKVVDITKNVSFPRERFSFPETVRPSEPADMVLELSAGSLDRYGVSLGDTVTIRKIE